MAMTVTIEQADIEQAIKDHVASIVELREGSELDVSLSATRGSAGFTAVIVIRQAGEARPVPIKVTPEKAPEAAAPKVEAEAAEQAQVVQPEPTAQAADAPAPKRRGRPPGSLNIAKTVTEAKAEEPEAPAVEPVEEAQEENLEGDQGEALDPAFVPENTKEPEAEEAQAEAAEEPAQEAAVEEKPAEAAPRQSLFSGLGKPKN